MTKTKKNEYRAYFMPTWAAKHGLCELCGHASHEGTCAWSLMRSGRVWIPSVEQELADVWDTNEEDRTDMEKVLAMLHGTYWAGDLKMSELEERAKTSRCHAMYANADAGDPTSAELIAWLRVITDGETMAYLCDVVVDEQWRGLGAGTALVQAAMEAQHPMDWLLHTIDAHRFYEKLGFERRGELLMEKRKKRGA